MAPGTTAIIDCDGLDRLIAVLQAKGYSVIGPTEGDGAVVYDAIASAADLPAGRTDETEGGQYRLKPRPDGALFGYSLAPQGWKRWLFPPRQRLWAAEKAGAGYRLVPDESGVPAYAFLGVRACEIQAILVQDKVFGGTPYSDAGYAARRDAALIVAVACDHSAATCFCASMGAGPAVERGFDLALSELIEDGRHVFVVESGSDKGAEILAALAAPAAGEIDRAAAAALPVRAAAQQTRAMDSGVEGLLKRHLDHPRWEEVAKRCLTCANCTMVCPTCFCNTVEDHTDLAGAKAERVRSWDSCFTVDFSYIHGGPMRAEPQARYRQWITHKLAHWHDQFDVSGCVGCGRCIAWCPVGIDITAEVAAIRASEHEE